MLWHIGQILARLLGTLLGACCIATAVFLYPDEDGKIQSGLEDFWVRVDDYKNLALTKHASFFTQVAKLESRVLDSIFGRKLFSGRSLGVSFGISLSTVSAFIIVLLVAIPSWPGRVR